MRESADDRRIIVSSDYTCKVHRLMLFYQLNYPAEMGNGKTAFTSPCRPHGVTSLSQS